MSGRWPFTRPSQPKRSVISRIEETELKRNQRSAEETLNCAQKLHKDVKKCSDHFTALSKNEEKLVENLMTSSLCSTEESLSEKTSLWLQRLHRHKTILHEMNANVNKVMIEPMKKFSSIAPTLNQALRDREKCVNELNRCQAKLEKYQEREHTGPNIVKLEASKKALEAAKSEYEAVNEPLQRDLPLLHAARVEYMEPCLRALVWSQYRFLRESCSCYEDVFSTMSSDQDFLMDSDNSLEHRMEQIRGLSIVLE